MNVCEMSTIYMHMLNTSLICLIDYLIHLKLPLNKIIIFKNEDKNRYNSITSVILDTISSIESLVVL